MDADTLPELPAVHFFSLTAPVKYCPPDKREALGRDYVLPVTSDLSAEEASAVVAAGWNTEELRFVVTTDRPFKEGSAARLERSDSIEFFIDTRDLKTAGFNTRFCHHFYLLPKPAKGEAPAGEVTRFRTEDTHPLCDPEDLQVIHHSIKQIELRVPVKCLVGYDPEQFPRLGFTYRINREVGERQHFGVTSNTYGFEHLPALWSTLRLTHENSPLRPTQKTRRKTR